MQENSMEAQHTNYKCFSLLPVFSARKLEVE